MMRTLLPKREKESLVRGRRKTTASGSRSRELRRKHGTAGRRPRRRVLSDPGQGCGS
ncbi:unnamed protein product [Ascophyllum nodosum]